jgi:hypothetical protein
LARASRQLDLTASLSFSPIRDRSAGFMIGCHACNRRLAVRSEHGWPAEGRLGKRVGASPRGFESRILRRVGKWALTCGNAVRSDRPGTSSHQISRPLVSVLVLSFRPPICAKHGPPTSRGVRRRSPTCASPNQPGRARPPAPQHALQTRSDLDRGWPPAILGEASSLWLRIRL